MKICYLSESGEKLYDIFMIIEMCGKSKTHIQRTISKLDIDKHSIYENRFLYTEKSVKNILEKIKSEEIGVEKKERKKSYNNTTKLYFHFVEGRGFLKNM